MSKRQFDLTERDIKAIHPVLNTFDQLMKAYLEQRNPTEDLDLRSINIVLNRVIEKFPTLTRDHKLQIHAIVHWQCIKFIQEVEALDEYEQPTPTLN